MKSRSTAGAVILTVAIAWQLVYTTAAVGQNARRSHWGEYNQPVPVGSRLATNAFSSSGSVAVVSDRPSREALPAAKPVAMGYSAGRGQVREADGAGRGTMWDGDWNGGCENCGDSCVDCGCGCHLHQGHVFFGEYLYLRPRNAEVAYAIPIDGPIGAPGANIPIPVGRAGVTDPDYQSGFRAGINFALDGCRSVTARFSQLESSTTDRISTSAQQVVRPLVAHPSSTNASSDFLQAMANYDIDFDLIDVEFRQLLRCGPNYAVNYSIGGRYAKLDQDLQTTFSDNGVAIVDTNIGFDGGGLRLGLDGERYAMARCWHVYARGAASFVAGQFRTRYFQGDSFDPVVADTAWEAGRVVTILDVEAGLGWRSPNGHLRISAGYLFSAWLNTVTTDEFIRSVQSGTLVSSDDSLSFDGLTAGAELRF